MYKREGNFFLILLFLFLIIISGCNSEKNENIETVNYDKIISQVDQVISYGNLKKALELIPEKTDNRELKLKKIYIYLKSGDLEKAELLSKELVIDKNDIEAYKFLAKIYFIKKDLVNFNKYIVLVPESDFDNELRNMKSGYERNLKQQAAEEKEIMINQISEMIASFNSMHYFEALSTSKTILEKSEAIYKKENMNFLKEVYNYSGQASIKVNNTDNAIYYYRKSIETDEKNPEAYKALGDIFGTRGRTALSLEYYYKAYELTKDIELYGNIGATYIKLGQYNEAKPILEEVFRKTSGNINAMYNLFLCYYYLNLIRDMRSLGQMILDIVPPNSQIGISVSSVMAGVAPLEDF
ncbi:MAG: hypothetical protein WC002_02310 [Candidatus Muiribacteriota bacterium]